MHVNQRSCKDQKSPCIHFNYVFVNHKAEKNYDVI